MAAFPAARAAAFASAMGRQQSFMTRLYAVLYTRFECPAGSDGCGQQGTATPLGAAGSSVASEKAGLLRAGSEVGSEKAEPCGVATASPHGVEGEAAQAGLLRAAAVAAAAAVAEAGFLETSAAAGLCLT